ncbi:hypothetical protein [Streptomyces sp. B1I3]|uniref:hypothetical protein n=1 Tax=Streptomyces sp. B1I3 TaxID=3042264 RepID=UPI00277D8B8B|nr:hypothetical protein [Streptomyces sp. B1I3]MDQ0798008.1 hypothetical protein [Streptomyces sp. B1I3]
MSGPGELTPLQEQLAEQGRQCLGMLTQGMEFGVEALAQERAVYVWQFGFGGGQIIVGEDGTLLFGASALWRDPLIEMWRTGRRTPRTVGAWDRRLRPAVPPGT